jgi:phosphate transport system permease protein
MASITPQLPISPADRPSRGDRTFRALCVAAALIALGIVSAALVFMFREAWPALKATGVRHFLLDSVWKPGEEEFGVLGLLEGTVIIASIAMLVAIPTAIIMALFINEYAPKSIARALTTAIDLLAALPSLIFALWGFWALKNHLVPVARWLSVHMVAIPFFRLTDRSAQLIGSSLIAGVVVGIMVLPIITSISREVMGRVPRDLCEGALALGGTRWGMIRAVVLPFGRSGIVSAALLGFGRALGETVAVAYLVSLTFKVNWHVLEQGAGSVASLIFTRFGEASTIERSGLVAAGLALLLLTFSVSLLSRYIVNRRAVT